MGPQSEPLAAESTGAPAAHGTSCPSCGADVGESDRFCEACRYDLVAGVATVAPARPGPRWLTSTGAPNACGACGGTAFGPEGYCDTCGQRRPAGRDHSELDLGAVAAVSDIGHRHRHNEDAVAIGLLPGALAAVVCDGVSSSTRPDTASYPAVDAAAEALLAALSGGDGPEPALEAAARAAQAAAALAGGAGPGGNPPSCTFVAGVVTADSVSVGWVGDSRAYWLPDRDAEPAVLTTDDSLAGRLAATGVPVAEVPQGATAGALVRWLGADAQDTAPHLVTIRPTGPGRLLVCSDGLFRYRPLPTELAAATPAGTPIDTARGLVALALNAGGQDNVTVAVLPYPAIERSEERPG
ncbi:protein phosphatase 2C domain-containing protein [Rugosimonospora acidiphila]|uniref:Protein phosphatase 2C domain-containing protein n=1 Tax=Rugosimonospora acidiphila TaxID=556531 RepID=A0ABP9SUJ4_9ACTN